MNERKIATRDDVMNMLNNYADFCNEHRINIELMILIRDWHMNAYQVLDKYIGDKKMALETLDGIKTIGGFNLIVMDDLREKYPSKFTESGAMDYAWFERDIRPYNYIYLRPDKNSLAFTIQDGPIKEVGVNGCQVETLIEAAQIIIEGLNKKISCYENFMVIKKLDEALMWSRERTMRRVEQNIEGISKETIA